MSYATNTHVERLLRHIPFGANTAELYEEHAHVDTIEPVDTRALEYTLQLVADPKVSLVLLTGDAGHGKTHLCRRLLERYGYDASAAREAMEADATGSSPILPRGGATGRPLRIMKDLSQIDPPAKAAEHILEILADPQSVGVVCANEGRLRDAIESLARADLDSVIRTLEAGLDQGMTTTDGAIHVVNLNFQSVTGDEGGLLLHVLEDWAANKRRWSRACQACDAAQTCPILKNQEFLGGTGLRDADGRRRRKAFVDLVRVVEQTGYVLTIRESLMLAAYALTGGLRCRDVHESHRRHGPRAVEKGKDLHVLDLLFERPLSERHRKQLPVLTELRRLDPGMRAIRDVDDLIQQEIDENEVRANDRDRTPPRTLKERRERRMSAEGKFRRMRREYFFDGKCPDVSIFRRVGLRYYDDFRRVVSSTHSKRDDQWTRVRDQLIAGLHVVQGIRPVSKSHLLLADPAFGNARSQSAIVAKRIPLSSIDVQPISTWWQAPDGRPPQLVQAVDWVERHIVIQLGRQRQDVIDVDLIQFEFLMRAGAGVSFRAFHAADIRRVLACLARVATAASADEETITILERGRIKNIMLDVGNTIRVGEG